MLKTLGAFTLTLALASLGSNFSTATGTVGNQDAKQQKPTAAGEYKEGGKEVGRGGKRFGRNIKRGNVVKAGKELGKGVGRGAKRVAKGTKKAVKP